MNINIQKVSKVIIKDSEGKTINVFKLGMVSTTTTEDKSIVLEIQAAKK